MSDNVMPIRTPAEQAIFKAYEALKGALPGASAQRDEGFAAFAATGLPHRRLEAWKYTDLRAALKEAAEPASRPNEAQTHVALKAPFPFSGVEGLTLSFVNGHHVASRGEVPAGVMVTPLAKALAEGHPLLARLGALALSKGDIALGLNAAFLTDGAIITVSSGTEVEAPVTLRFVTSGPSPVATAARVLLVVEEGASLTVVESHEGQGSLAHQPNTAFEIVAAARARVQHVRLGLNGEGAIALSTLTADLGDGAEVTSLNVALRGAVTRHQVFARLSGGNARLRLNGATLLRGRQHADSTLVVEHAAEPGGESRELFRTVVADEATGVFQGKIIVQPLAQKTDGRMASNAILLGEGATMNNKPELEIFADDVACAHGATCGSLDGELLFYLMSRGLSRGEAEALMVESFVGEAIDIIEHDAIRTVLHALVEDWLAERAVSQVAGASP